MTRVLFGAALTLSAFLLFVVQPMVARAILPWFGGSSSLWTTCMLFFQLALLLGYGYSHALTRFASAVKQFRIHAVLLVGSALVLPPLPGGQWKPADLHDPPAQVALLLLMVVGMPYLALSTTAPLVQAWYARVFPGRSPYRLYAWSNASSLVALISYPVLIEPFFTLRQQGMMWSVLYLTFVAVCLPCALAATKSPARPAKPARRAAKPAPDPRAPGVREMAVWLWLAFLASTVLLGTTNELCQDIAVVPFLWVVPLSLYLATFVLCFQWDWLYRRRMFLPLSVLCIWAMGESSYLGAEPPLRLDVAIWCAALFVFCMICHGELVRRQPGKDHLTLFYVVMAAGGALGGVCVALVAPHVFSSFLELPLGLAAIVVTAALMLAAGGSSGVNRWRIPVSGRAVAMLYLLVAGGMTAYVRSGADPGGSVLDQRRNFFGVVRVEEGPEGDGGPDLRWLFNGRIVHGAQFRQAGKARVPTTYFSGRSGLGLALVNLPRRGRDRHIGVVGLGAGTIAAYGHAGDRLRFYEINPLVQELTQQYFTFISQCPCRVDVVIGDARVSLERESPQDFDFLVLDAFSGDAIPTHLLTAEALQVYLRHLRPDGILAFHISNAYVDLTPVLRGLADAGGLTGMLVQNEENDEQCIFGADWVLLSRNPRVIDRPGFRAFSSPGWRQASSIYWTDDFTSLARVFSRTP
ncbi:MAG: fused MFS/spermidine synthase [Acidobacteria bacterium]|nr:fused MFS/spermidine synthase [Acidobacteriota bacterium]